MTKEKQMTVRLAAAKDISADRFALKDMMVLKIFLGGKELSLLSTDFSKSLAKQGGSSQLTVGL